MPSAISCVQQYTVGIASAEAGVLPDSLKSGYAPSRGREALLLRSSGFLDLVEKRRVKKFVVMSNDERIC